MILKKKYNSHNMHTTETKQNVPITDMKERLSDILMVLSWREIAKNYFGKSSSWLYHKMDGISGNGTPGGFTEKEVEMMKNALIDLSVRIRTAADKI